jgi:putative transposase
MCEVLNAILYMAAGGIPWRELPKGFPPGSTVRGYFYKWGNVGALDQMNFALASILIAHIRIQIGRLAKYCYA